MAEYLRKLLNLRPGEGGRVLLLCLFIFTTHACQVIGKVLQLSLFLASYGRSAIPYAFLLSAVGVTCFSLLFAALAKNVGKRKLVPTSLLFIAAGFALWRLVIFGRTGHDAFVLYIWIDIATVLAVVLAWNYVNDACDSREGKRLFPLAALGASFAFLFNGFGIHPLVKLGLPAEDLAFFIIAALLLSVFVFYVLEARYSVCLDCDMSSGRERGRGTGNAHKINQDRKENRESLISGRKQVLDEGMMSKKRQQARGGFKNHLRWVLLSLRQGFAQLAANDLIRMFAVVTVLTILTQQLLDFMFMSALKARFVKADLALFIGVFMGSLGAAQIILQLVVTGRFLNRFGGSLCLMMEPVFVAISSIFYVVFPGFWFLMGFRFFDRILKTSFYSPSLQTLYTPVEPKSKIQAMALIKGVVSPLAKVAGALGLLFFWEGLNLRWIAIGTGLFSGAAALYVGLKAKKAYLGALHSALTRRKLTSGSRLNERSTPVVDGTALRMVKQSLQEGPAGAAVFALRFLAHLPPAQSRPLLTLALESEHSEVRREALSLLEEGGPAELEVIVSKGLEDDVGGVVLRALGGLARLKQTSARFRVEGFLSDERLSVRAGAALWLRKLFPQNQGDAGRVWAEILGDDCIETRLAAATALQELGDLSFTADVKTLLYDVDERVREAALSAAGELGMGTLIEDIFLCFDTRGPRDPAARALEKLGEPAVKAIRAFIEKNYSREDLYRRVPWILSAIEGAAATRLLVDLLSHEQHEVRLRSARILSRRAPGSLEEARLLELLDVELESAYCFMALQEYFSGLHACSHESALLLDQIWYRRSQIDKRIMALLGMAIDLQTADMIFANLESGLKRQRAGAVELLENVTTPEVSGRLIPLFEGHFGSGCMVRLPEKLFEIYSETFSNPIQAIVSGDDRYLKAFLLYECASELEKRAQGALTKEVQSLLPLIEKILFLKSAPIFSGLSGEELHRIAEIAEEVSYSADDVVFRQNDPGDAMYLVLHGRVSIRIQGREVVRLGSKECFGEMALLDNLPRSADVVVLSEADFLRIEADSFDELLEQKHAIVKGIFKVLTGRLREANARTQQEAIVGDRESN